jgi:hypothetical protein
MCSQSENLKILKRKITVRNLCDLAQYQIYGGATGTLQIRNETHLLYSGIYFSNIVLFVFLVFTSRTNKCHNLNFVLLIGASTFRLPRRPHNCKSGPVLAIITCINETLAIMRCCRLGQASERVGIYCPI